MSRVRVSQPYAAQYADPISFEAGDPIEVGKQDAGFPGWYWCRNHSGTEGWVHKSFLSATAGMARGLLSYSARELSVYAGTEADVLARLSGWLLVKLDDGSVGWFPESHAQECT